MMVVVRGRAQQQHEPTHLHLHLHLSLAASTVPPWEARGVAQPASHHYLTTHTRILTGAARGAG